MIKLSKLLLLGILLLQNTISIGNDCIFITTARKLNIEKTIIKVETLDKKTGKYQATSKNGNLLLASFDQCDIRAEAHFYSKTTITKDQKANILRWMLAALVSPNNYKEIKNQIKSSTDYLDYKSYTFGNKFVDHRFEFMPSDKPQFKSVLHYTWLPDYPG